MNKAETIEAALRGEGCLGRAADDEPVFVLRAKDPCMAAIIDRWCGLAPEYHEREKIEQARTEINDVNRWRRKNGYRV